MWETWKYHPIRNYETKHSFHRSKINISSHNKLREASCTYASLKQVYLIVHIWHMIILTWGNWADFTQERRATNSSSLLNTHMYVQTCRASHRLLSCVDPRHSLINQFCSHLNYYQDQDLLSTSSTGNAWTSPPDATKTKQCVWHLYQNRDAKNGWLKTTYREIILGKGSGGLVI